MNVSSTFPILSSSQGPWVRLTSFNLLSLPTLWAWILPQQTLESHTGRAQPPRLSRIIQVTLLCRDRAKNQWGEWPRKVPSHPLRNIQQSYQELQEMSWKPLGHASQQPRDSNTSCAISLLMKKNICSSCVGPKACLLGLPHWATATQSMVERVLDWNSRGK